MVQSNLMRKKKKHECSFSGDFRPLARRNNGTQSLEGQGVKTGAGRRGREGSAKDAKENPNKYLAALSRPSRDLRVLCVRKSAFESLV